MRRSALATIVVDDPMVAATGHRICNDCVKACIYPQQTPVDISQAETRTLNDAHLAIDGRHFAAIDEDGRPVRPETANPKPAQAQVLPRGAADG